MKKITLIWAFTLFVFAGLANGLLTNSNQSAQFIRMMSRNASLGIDATYFNPAGLTKLEDGWHFSVNSQTIMQSRSIESTFPLLKDDSYDGNITIPVFPSGYAVIKNERLALSFGINPVAGGGKLDFERGLPSFEIPLSKFAAGLATAAPLLQQYDIPAVSGYGADLSFTGSSVYWGVQLGLTYEINEMFSVYGGARYTPSKNTYYGTINDITVETSSGPVGAENYQGMVSPILGGAASMLQTASSGLNAGIQAGLVEPNAPVSNPEMVEVLALLGESGATNQEAVAIFSSTSQGLEAILAADVSNKLVDVDQTGAGITPVVGLNFSPNEFLNLGMRYEHQTNMTLTNNTSSDDMGLFPDGETSPGDVPGIFGVGVGVTDNYWFELQLSYNLYLDKNIDWGPNIRDITTWRSVDPSRIRQQTLESNSFDLALGIQFNVTEYFSISGGGMYQKSAVSESYNSDFDYTSPTIIGLGGGIMYMVNDQLTIDLGTSYIMYKDTPARFFDPFIDTNYDDFYGKSSLNIAVGISYSIPY